MTGYDGGQTRRGTGLYTTGGTLTVSDTLFEANAMNLVYGGAFHASNVNPLDIEECRFLHNYACGNSATSRGNVFHLDGSAQRVSLRRVVLAGNGHAGGTGYGDIFLANGTLGMTNVLMTGDPLSDYTLEPPRRGDRVDLGAYGNTPVASRTYRPEETLLMVR